jgi:5-methylcytosine-specific restriction enzyme subunit McrC
VANPDRGSLVIAPFQEHGRSDPFQADSAQRDRLQAALPEGLTLEAIVDIPGSYRLAAGPVAGVLDIGGVHLEIRPKLEIGRLLFLIGYALDRRFWRDPITRFAEDVSLVDAVAAAAMRQASRALARGRLHGYTDREDSLQTVRGRIQIGRQLSRWQGRMPPVEVGFQEFTDDILEHRLLKAATSALLRWPIRQQTTWEALRHVDALLAPISTVHFPRTTVPAVIYTRLNEHYRTAVELARLVLRLSAFEARAGGVRASGLLVNMNLVFQDFVEVALGEASALFGVSVRGQDTRHALDDDRAIRLKPDLVLERNGVPTMVGDAKYKRLEINGLPNADVYQALAYAVGLNLPSASLIYPATEAAGADHTITNAGVRIVVRTLDLALAPDRLLAQVAQLAEELAGEMGGIHDLAS